tara:strand:- start:13152 stop:13385 length:234 start_codon:yes stop_codon:yes gene_type:complete
MLPTGGLMNQEKEVTKWTTMAIRKNTMDKVNEMANYEHRTAGEMVSVMLRLYNEKMCKELNLSANELKTFLQNYERD